MIPLLVNAKQQRLVKPNMFTIALRRDRDASRNLITYVDVDTKNCAAIKAYLPRFLPLDALSFGEYQLTKPYDPWSRCDSMFRFWSTYDVSAIRNFFSI